MEGEMRMKGGGQTSVTTDLNEDCCSDSNDGRIISCQKTMKRRSPGHVLEEDHGTMTMVMRRRVAFFSISKLLLKQHHQCSLDGVGGCDHGSVLRLIHHRHHWQQQQSLENNDNLISFSFHFFSEERESPQIPVDLSL
jgi:hypothetical protein